MSDEVIIYIAPPSTESGQWRARSNGCPEEERPDEESAVAFAATRARMIESAGRVAIIKVKRADGTFDVFRT